MIDKLISGGILSFNYALVALSLLLMFVFVTMKLIRPAMRSYNVSKALENIATNPKHHWFYGHMKFVS